MELAGALKDDLDQPNVNDMELAVALKDDLDQPNVNERV